MAYMRIGLEQIVVAPSHDSHLVEMNCPRFRRVDWCHLVGSFYDRIKSRTKVFSSGYVFTGKLAPVSGKLAPVSGKRPIHTHTYCEAAMFQTEYLQGSRLQWNSKNFVFPNFLSPGVCAHWLIKFLDPTGAVWKILWENVSQIGAQAKGSMESATCDRWFRHKPRTHTRLDPSSSCRNDRIKWWILSFDLQIVCCDF